MLHRFNVDMGKYLAQTFPQEYCSIVKKRLNDTEFDQICAHFEELSALMYNSDTAGLQDLSDRDIVESLDGLREEISDALSKPSK